MDYQRNYVRDGLRGCREDDGEALNEEDNSVLKEVEFYKNRLYKKIDSCFVRYGLEGLRKIDEGIAFALDRYIKGLKGELVPVQANTNPVPSISEAAGNPAPQKPVGISVKAQQRSAQKPILDMSDRFNMDVINKVLTDIIPPTEIHPVEVRSNIPVQQIMEARKQSSAYVSPQQHMTESIEGDTMVEVGNEESGSQLNPLLPEDDQEIVPQQSTSSYDIVDDMLDTQTKQEVENSNLICPTNYDYQPGIDEEEEDMGGVIEVENDTPIDTSKSQRKSRKKKSGE